MRWRSLIGTGVVLVAVIAAVVLLRTQSPPQRVAAATEPPSTSVPPPVSDRKSARLTTAFLTTTALPPAYRFDSYPAQHAEFRFQRYVDPQPGLDPDVYEAIGLLVRNSDNARLDFVSVSVAHLSTRQDRDSYGACDATGFHDGSSCTDRVLPDGTHAKVVRNPAFAQSVASDQTEGERPGMETRLTAVYPNGTLLIVAVTSTAGAGIPLDDAAMLKLATIRAVPANGPA